MSGFLISVLLGLLLVFYSERKAAEKQTDDAYKIIAMRDEVISKQDAIIKELRSQLDE